MLDPARLVFIDETAVSTNLARVRGRAPSGDRVIGTVPLGAWETITFVAALRHNKMTAPMVVEGAMTGEMFLAYIEQCLVPTLRLPYSKFKAFLRKVAARTVPGLTRAIRSFVPQLGPRECANYFRHAGYASI